MRIQSRRDQLDQAAIVEALRAHLMRRHSNTESRLVTELPLRTGSSRADLVLLGDQIQAFEVKSDCDTLRRLEAQVSAYSRVFDQVTIVSGAMHLAAASIAVPEWWGIMLAFPDARGRATFATVRPPRNNPSPDNYALAQLLPIREIISSISAHCSTVTHMPPSRREACRKLASIASRELLTSIVTTSMIKRASPGAVSRPA
jgi:hypothetical protein